VNRGKQEAAESIVRSLKRTDRRDLRHLQTSDERTQGAHLPQEKEMEVPQVRPDQDASAEVA